ncbi:ABC-type nitrate/sulfonate/bicarbonate transport system ATPase subunit [Mesorhizobium robiniae]|uniref:ABC-type nitrate/sulfonate/bicarbonate transport system ATPase subunit n=1 Tax=Mesorhizobium robiniae TaxID=559315 RepID=A0ABV2GZ34_9HYPH
MGSAERALIFQEPRLLLWLTVLRNVAVAAVEAARHG